MVTPIKRGTAQKLGLRKPTGAYRYRGGSTVYIDEGISRYGITVDELATRERIKDFANACGVSLEGWQIEWVARNTPSLRR